MKKLNAFDWVALVLVIIGGLNWGLVALNFNLVTFLVGSWPWLETLVYALVGLSAIWMVVVMAKGNSSSNI
jgi:hypothetical protein